MLWIRGLARYKQGQNGNGGGGSSVDSRFANCLLLNTLQSKCTVWYGTVQSTRFCLPAFLFWKKSRIFLVRVCLVLVVLSSKLKSAKVLNRLLLGDHHYRTVPLITAFSSSSSSSEPLFDGLIALIEPQMVHLWLELKRKKVKEECKQIGNR